MAVTVHIDQSAINRAFADMAPSAALHKTAIRKAGVALSLMIQQTLRQQGKDYYDAAADATSMEETAEGVSVSIAWRGIGLHWIGTQGYLAARCGPPDALRKSPASDSEPRHPHHQRATRAWRDPKHLQRRLPQRGLAIHPLQKWRTEWKCNRCPDSQDSPVLHREESGPQAFQQRNENRRRPLYPVPGSNDCSYSWHPADDGPNGAARRGNIPHPNRKRIMIPSIDQTMSCRIIERLKSSKELSCHIFDAPFDPEYAANDIIMSAMGNNGVVLVCPGDADEYQDGHGQTAEPTMWRQYFIIVAIYHNAALFPEECLTPAYYLRAVGDVIEHALWNWNPLPFPAPAMMKPKIKGRFASSGIIDGEKRQMNVLTVDYRVPININIRTKTEFHEQNAKK